MNCIIPYLLLKKFPSQYTIYLLGNKSDYIPLQVDVTFTRQDKSGDQECYDLTILDDDIVEASETLSVELVNPVGVRVISGSITITIQPTPQDPDSKFRYIFFLEYEMRICHV